jgi:hypothetical protein
MDDNPYKSPLAADDAERATRSRLVRYLAGAGFLAPASWLLGRGLIPPDNVADRFSLVAWLVLTTIWAVIVCLAPRNPAANVVASGDECRPERP